MNKSILSLARLLYAALTGGSLVAASLTPGLIATVGAYTLQAGIAAAVAAVVPLGLDRSVARMRASGQISFDMPKALVQFRVVELALLALIATGAAVLTQQYALTGACLMFASSRLVLGDLEALWIASPRPTRWLGASLVANGVISAAGIYLGAAHGPEAMLALSSVANFVAAGILLWRGGFRTGQADLRRVRRESFGFGASAAVAVIYARADVFIIAIIGVDLASVAVYGIILRVFDALALIRGSVAQIEIRTLATKPSRLRLGEAMNVGRRAIFASAGAAIALAPVIVLALQLPIFSAWKGDESAIYTALICVPLFMTHLATSAVVLADARTHLLLAGSILSAASAVAVKWALISAAGVTGAVASIGICEVLSFVIFATLYRGRMDARAVLTYVAVPILFSIFLIPAMLLSERL